MVNPLRYGHRYDLHIVIPLLFGTAPMAIRYHHENAFYIGKNETLDGERSDYRFLTTRGELCRGSGIEGHDDLDIKSLTMILEKGLLIPAYVEPTSEPQREYLTSLLPRLTARMNSHK
jgi:hypothetical protein